MENSADILMVAYPFPPYKWAGGASIRLVKFLKYLRRLRPNWKLSVATAGYGGAEKTLERVTDDLLAELPADVEINRIDDPALASWPTAPIAMRALAKLVRPIAPTLADKLNPPVAAAENLEPDNYAAWVQSLIDWARRCGRSYDIVYLSCPPYSTATAAAELKKIFDCPVVIDIKDNWISAREKLSEDRRKLQQAMEDDAIDAASGVICVTAGAMEHYIDHYGQRISDKIHLITNGVDLDDFDSLYGDSGKPRKNFTVSYTGSLGGDNRSPETFFTAFKMLLGTEGVDPDKCFASFPAAMAEKFWQLGKQMGLSQHLIKAETLEREKYVQRLNSSQVLLSINYRGETTLIPGKLYEYWAAGRPILLLEEPGAATALVQRFDLGFCADVDDVKAIYDSLYELWRQFDNGESFTPRTAGLNRFSRQGLSEQLASLFDSLMARAQRDRRSGSSDDEREIHDV